MDVEQNSVMDLMRHVGNNNQAKAADDINSIKVRANATPVSPQAAQTIVNSKINK
jgi:hypothetical protein